MHSHLIIAALGFLSFVQADAAPESQWVSFSRAGAPNSNLQCFTPNNVGVADGYLVITTKLDAATCSSIDLPHAKYHYTSGFVSMRSFHFLYGVLEFRAKFGGGMGSGAWPVVWMADASCQASDPTGTDDKCNEQEIDIAEILHSDFTHVNQEIHVDHFAHNDGCTASTRDTSESFHVYQLVWSPGSLIFKIDGATTCTIAKPYIPRAAMYVKIDTFVGNSGGPLKKSTLPWTTLIDYVKVTQDSAVLFNDDFNLPSTVQPGPVAINNSFFAFHLAQLKFASSWLRLTLVAPIVCLILAIAAIVLRRKIV